MTKFNYNISFTNSLFLSLLIFSAICITCIQVYTWKVMGNQLYTQLGQKALIQAKEIAIIPNLIDAVDHNNIAKIEALLTHITSKSDANFIVIGDKNTNRLFHSQKSLLNKPMQGEDNAAVLNGESIISISEGSLGISLRGKAPIINHTGEVIGIVSVGYMQHEIDNLHILQFIPLIIFCSVLFIALFIFSWFFSRHIKHQMFNLEPKEIALLVHRQDVILESIFEGLIVIDLNYNITKINQAARNLLNIEQRSTQLVGMPLAHFTTPIDFIYNEQNQFTDQHDEICHFNDVVVIASRVRIIIDGKIQGWIITFRNKNDINLLSLQLSQIKQYADNLRVTRHEHLNWMATLYGMLHMQRYNEAMNLIKSQSANNQQILDDVTQRFKNPSICGLLLGKYAKAHELGLELVFDPACQLHHPLMTLDDHELMSIIGNVLDNAFNASLHTNSEFKKIECYLSDETDEIVFEVADQGCGISHTIKESIFERGITTQENSEHGIGLYLVDMYVKKANGYITITNNIPHGTVFSVFIPKIAPLQTEKVNKENIANES